MTTTDSASSLSGAVVGGPADPTGEGGKAGQPAQLREIRARNGVQTPPKPDYGAWGYDRRHRYEGCNHAPTKPTSDIPEADLAVIQRATRFADVLGFDHHTAIRLAAAGYAFTRAPARSLPSSQIAPRIVDISAVALPVHEDQKTKEA